MRIIATAIYERQARRLLTVAERAAAEGEVMARPEAWPVIPGTGGARKARVGFGGRGKSGGGRLIYFFAPSPELLVLLNLYSKAAKEDDLTSGDKKAIRNAIRTLGKPDPAGPQHRGGGA